MSPESAWEVPDSNGLKGSTDLFAPKSVMVGGSKELFDASSGWSRNSLRALYLSDEEAVEGAKGAADIGIEATRGNTTALEDASTAATG